MVLQGMKSADSTMLADASSEIAMLRGEQSTLRLRVRTLQETVDNMSARNAQLLADLQAANIVDTAGGMSLPSVTTNSLPSSCQHLSEEFFWRECY